MSQKLFLLSISAICLAQLASADPASITNGTDWKDTDGKVKMEYREKWSPLSPRK